MLTKYRSKCIQTRLFLLSFFEVQLILVLSVCIIFLNLDSRYYILDLGLYYIVHYFLINVLNTSQLRFQCNTGHYSQMKI